jgi:hypothetical protein
MWLVVSGSLLGAGGPDPGTIEADVEVVTSSPRHVDETGIGTFLVVGACVPTAKGVASHGCSGAPPRSGGLVRSPTLGFAAQHDVEALPVDLPAVQTHAPGGGRQLSIVRVWLARPGDLTVTLSTAPDERFSARAVASTARPHPVEPDEDAVRWVVDGAAAGAHEFQVAFDIATQSGVRVLPRVEVELAVDGAELLHSLDGPVGSGLATRRTSRVVMTQRVGTDGSPPARSGPSTAGVATNDGIVQAFTSTGGLDAGGEYDPAIGGGFAHTWDVRLADVSPGFAAHANSTSSLAVADLAGKAELVSQFDPATSRRRLGLRVPSPPLDARGRFHAGDSVAAGWTFTSLDVSTSEVRQPTAPGGAVRFVWDGDWASTWVDSVANAGPSGEPNGLRPDAVAGSRLARSVSGETRSSGRHLLGFPLVAVVDGGDVDNRSGPAPVVGTPLRVDAPTGHRIVAVFLTTVTRDPMRLEVSVEMDDGLPAAPWLVPARAVTLTPRIAPGGHWLQTSRAGTDWDWAAGVHVHMLTRPVGTASGTPPTTVHEVDVPVGATGTLEVLTPRGVPVIAHLGSGERKVTEVRLDG